MSIRAVIMLQFEQAASVHKKKKLAQLSGNLPLLECGLVWRMRSASIHSLRSMRVTFT